MIDLRDYQQIAIDDTYQQLKAKDNILIRLATGAGKGHLYLKLAFDCVKFNIPFVLVMRRRELIKQASKKMDQHKIDHGVYMAGHHRYDPKKLVQVCSIDTLSARKIYPHHDKSMTMIVIDESHDYHPRSKSYTDFIDVYKSKKVIGMTATPFRDNSLFDAIVYPISNLELLAQGYLVPARTFVPNIIDVSNVKIKTTGEFDESQLAECVMQNEIIGNIVNDWIKYGKGKRTICFAVSIEHSRALCTQFKSRGFRAVHADASTSSSDRDRIFSDLARGKIDIVCNVGIASTGLDITEIECIQFARPTNSEILFLQMVGRGLRPSPEIGKQDCTIIDNAGNTLRHGSPFKDRTATLDRVPTSKKEKNDLSVRSCEECFYVYDATLDSCPECGHKNEKKLREIKSKDGELVEYTSLSDEEMFVLKKNMFFKDWFKLGHVMEKRNLPNSWRVRMLRKKYQDDFNKLQELVK